jgi:hypothetical protein
MSFMDRAKEKADELAKKAKPMADELAKKARPMAEDLAKKAKPAAEQLRERATTMAQNAKKSRSGEGPAAGPDVTVGPTAAGATPTGADGSIKPPSTPDQSEHIDVPTIDTPPSTPGSQSGI